jgi:hypothetical protein
VSELEHVDSLLRESCGPVPSSAAWEELVQFLNENFANNPHAVLAIRVSGFLQNLKGGIRVSTLNTLAGYMRASEWRRSLLQLLAGSKSMRARTLALLIAMPGDFGEPAERLVLRSLLVSRRVPSRIQAAALAHVIDASGTVDKIDDLLEAFLHSRSASRGKRRFDRLRSLLQDPSVLRDRSHPSDADDQIVCPRCQTRLRRPEMIRHLLEKHALVLEGKRVRNAWRVVDLLLAKYRRTRAKHWLRRCFDLVAQLNDPIGTRHLQQHMVLQRVAANAMMRRLLLSARDNQTALCPFCYAQAPVPPSRYIQPVPQSHGLLSWKGYRIHLRNDTPLPQLTIQTPDETVFSGREPGHLFSRQGFILFGAIPLAVLAVLLALSGAPSFWMVASLLLAAAAYGWSWLRGWLEPSCVDRAIDFAWTILCPRLLARGLTEPDAEFLAALALASVGKGLPERREYWLEQLRNDRHQAVADGRAPSTHAACLTRLAISDAASRDVDLAALTASALSRCWKAEQPLSFAQQLLVDWQTTNWTKGAQSRFRILLLDQAFAEGWEVVSLRKLKAEAPALAASLKVADTKRLAELRWLWSSRASAPWLNIGPSHTCFELAQQEPPQNALFELHPDLLFVESQKDGMIICSSGVYWRNLHFPEVPRHVRITERVAVDHRSYTLHLGKESVALNYDPSALVDRLDRWMTYLREDFQIKAKKTRKWVAPEETKFLPPGELAVCPECHHPFAGAAGELGVKIVES